MKKLKDIYKQPIEYLVALLLVYGNGSWLQQGYNMPFKIVLISALFLFFMLQAKSKKLNYANPVSLIVPTFLIVSTFLNFSDKSNLNTLLSILSIIFILSFFSIKTLTILLDKYAEIIYGLIICSLIISFIKILYPEIVFHFPFRNDSFAGRTGGYYNLFVFTERITSPLSPFRVQSIFWEPGAWAVNQGFAFFWYMIFRKEYKKFKIFLISSILTFSTSGIIFTLIFSFYLFMKRIDYSLIRTIKKAAFILVGISIIIGFQASTKNFALIPPGGFGRDFDHSLFNRATRTVLLMTTEKLFKGGASYGVLEGRFASLTDTFEHSIEKPFLGVGMLKFEYRPIVHHVFGEIIHQLGYIFLLFWIILFSQLFKQIPLIYAATLIFSLLFAEAYAFGTLFILIIVFGAKTLLDIKAIKTKAINIGY